MVGDVLGPAAGQPRHVPGLAGEHCQQLEPVTRAPDGEGVALVSGLKIIYLVVEYLLELQTKDPMKVSNY